MKCLKDFIEETKLYMNFDDCFKKFNAILKKSLRWCEKTKWRAIQENSLTKHKVTYELILKKKNIVKTFYQSQIFMNKMASLR